MFKVVFIEWATHGRDFEIDLPLMYFFEKVLKWKVDYISIFDLPKIISSFPDLIIMSNTGGATVNAEISKFAKDSNIILFSHVSEGLFRKSNIKDMVYGWNQNLNEVHTTYWSKQSYNLAIKFFPEIYNKSFVSGSLSHDKYKIFSKNSFINIGKYNKVISYMAFDFHNVLANKQEFEKRLGKKLVALQEKHIDIINSMLLNIIENHKDILFLLKPHPGDGNKIPMELKGLDKCENVKFVYNYSTVDIINSSDIILNFQSSTNLEAWLLEKPSITMFEDTDFFEIYEVTKGSLNLSNIEVLNDTISEFYNTKKIKSFEKNKETRENLISKYIGFSDGLNHVRFMSFLRPYIQKIENGEIKKGRWNIALKRRLKGYAQYLVYSLAKGRYNTPILKKWAHIYDMFSDEEVNQQKELRYKDFDVFYEKNKNKIDKIYNNYANNWKKEVGIK